jgi:serine/threonine-protein kinase
MFAGRYRIHGLLGRGGMGEVYRADDLKLGQSVALKFLPQDLQKDPGRLDRFLSEVRLARQIAHPNVCRVYDVGEGEGQHFLSMEFVDGEDLASLLLRIGRLPHDKALQIARQLCAGLAAAHEQGILHRDLKPANVMIDGRGRVRITDFGLATLAGGADDGKLVGTPGYMSPEQLESQPFTARSDVYALGLVLFELFTGKRAFKAGSLRELRRLQLESAPATPSSLVDQLDPTVDHAILRCLERDPAQRIASPLAVAASFPGGDPLAAALMAGETPSPEMVAAAGPQGGLEPGVVVACVLVVLAGWVPGLLFPDTTIFTRMDMPKSFAVLKDDAREISRRLGYEAEPADSSASFELDSLAFVPAPGETPDASIADQPGQRIVELFYRQAPGPLGPNALNGNVTGWDPKPQRGELVLRLDLQGHLTYLRAQALRSDPVGKVPSPTDWPALFEVAGLDIEAFETAEPTIRPRVYADERRAWTGILPDRADLPVRIEAAACAGRPVYMSQITPTDSAWEPGGEAVGQDSNRLFEVSGVIVFTLVMLLGVGAVFLALRNSRQGRGDRQGAWRMAVLVFALRFSHWLFTGHHLAGGDEIPQLGIAIIGALALGALAWVLYMALEPYVRRLWPQTLVSWSRLLAGRFFDPLVGRDLLIGFTANAFLRVAFTGLWQFGMGRGLLPALMYAGPLGPMRGGRFAVGHLFQVLLEQIAVALILLMLLLLLRIVFRRTWIAALSFFLFLTVVLALQLGGITGGQPAGVALGALNGALQATFFIVVMTRFGLVAMIGAMVFGTLSGDYWFGLSASSPYIGTTMFGWAVTLLLLGYAAWVSLAGRALFRDAILDAEPAKQ